MVQNRLNRRADLAIGLVALVTAVVTLGPWRFRGAETEESSGDEPAAWQHFSERCASDSLRTLAVEEADFRGCDRDWNHVNDFWTTNITDLYQMTSAESAKEGPLLEIDPGEEE